MTVEWLLDSDPALRWQVLRDLLGVPEVEWQAERAKVATEGWGARLMAARGPDGQWAGGAHFPHDFAWGSGEPQPWTATSHALAQLRHFGLPTDHPWVAETVDLIAANCRWEHDGQPYWEGEVEPCINGALVANGTYFGVDMTPVVERLVGEVLSDGGWNCEAENGSVRSSFDTTINVLEGLLEYERVTGGTDASVEARRSGEEYVLERHLFRRATTGEPADGRYLLLIYPDRWFYTVGRGLDYFRTAASTVGGSHDGRLAEGIDLLRSRRSDDGRWPLDWQPKGRTWFDINDGVGQPSRWVTLRAMRVLDWWDRQT